MTGYWGTLFHVFAVGVMGMLLGLRAEASPDLCIDAARVVARETGVPASVLHSITLTETGRVSGGTTKPWPWSVNMEGKGVWFETDEDARAYVFKHFKRGARSFDVGCFQINYKWHGQNFDSIEAMFDPLINTRYAAQFLLQLHDEFGDWSRAAGAYHSRTEKHARKYRSRFDAFRAEYAFLDRESNEPRSVHSLSPETDQGRDNHFPLLRGSAAAGQLGSLMPHNASPSKSLLSRPRG